MFYEKERIYKSELNNYHLEFCVNLTMLARELKIDQSILLEFLDSHTALSIIRKTIVAEFDKLKLELTAEEKLKRIQEIISEKNGVADSQEFGLHYGQISNYLDQIEEMISK